MPDSRHKSRSRSPYQDDRSERSHRQYRSRSPSKRHKHSHSSTSTRAKPLPFGAQDLSRNALPTYNPLFALYLDIQKQIILEALDEKEVKGRWKSFVGKWNRGELAEGWYAPETLAKAQASADGERRTATKVHCTEYTPTGQTSQTRHEDEPSDDDYGPALPNSLTSRHDEHTSPSTRGHGATIPSLNDLRARDEESLEDATTARQNYIDSIRYERKLDRNQQKEQLEDLVPRAQAGTRERQLEKKREKADSNWSFAAAKEAGGDVELRESEVMGDEDSLGELKRMKHEREKKKNERELRKEEILRARRAEREVRLQAVKEREEKTMSVFREIARQRFGGGTPEEP
ncbi:hypothetical protein H2200_005637 [Cladophialophora chaetospira]|uniref:Uncharacterized protein n=1 Tax=Cladophialophora chaetospira TaxID=386627 RepID=A0AA39CJT7_9EURO|nr:hypothetical protein H2200_005637 [Cladophialophora chaetospira]